MNRYQNYDRNVDGDPAIINLSFLNFEQGSKEIPQTARLVLVLVEARLLNPLAGAQDLQPRLLRFKGDLSAEGFFSRFIRVDLYQGARHQDGRTLLALRSFLREVRTTFANLLGVVLVGSFPEATLVRRTIWRPSFNVTIAGVAYQNTPYLAIEPEMIAPRSEIVLADLNGNWQSLYHENFEALESIRAIPDAATAATTWPVDGAIFSSTAFDRTTTSYRDFFFINDGDYTSLNAPAGQLRLLIRHRQLHPELAAADRNLPNPLCRPDILVSRINARHIAVNPKPSIVGDSGVRPLDGQGFPQSFTSNQVYDTWLGFFQQDPILERRVLNDYFDRNHRFRIGAFADLPFRTGAVAAPDFNAGGTAGYLAPASNKFAPPLVQGSATVLDYVRWCKQPAVLRCIMAHSSAYSSQFDANYSPAALENEMGGRPFRWRRVGNTYTPSLQDQGPHADFYVHRTAWQNGVLASAGANLIIHGGCEVNVPADTQTKTYYQEGYAGWQNAEGLLFYMNGVAMIARAKVFNDLPTGFPGAFALTSRARFGDGWRAFFDYEAADANLGKFGSAVRSKKAYFWSMIGDWTVRLRYRGGLAILGFDPQFRALHVHADQAWIDGWNFDTTVNGIRGAGDIDGDGRAEFVITSDWGIGVLKHEGQRWQQLVVAPNDTWFGGWRYNASVNVGKDRHQGLGKFTGGTAHEILLTSSWGIGVLAYVGNTLTAPVIQPNGTRFGGWLFDSRANQIVGIGEMDGNGRDEIVIISDWGIGILGAIGNTFNSLMLAPNGTRFGGWLYNSRQNNIHPLGDYDGDGCQEILITSDWGIGILKLAGNTLTSVAMHANGSNLGGYGLNTRTSQIVAVGDLAGDGRARIVIADGNGLHVLELRQGALRQSAFWANGDRAGGWLLNTADNRFGPVGDLDGDGRAEVVIRSPWGLGIIGLQDAVFRCPTLHAYGTRLGDWILERNDRVAALDNFSGSIVKRELLIQKGV
jgi:hypothetical protein